MAKVQGRKPPRRPRPKSTPPSHAVLDAELRELAMLLDEHRQTDALGVKVPWRDGRNAIGLAMATTEHTLLAQGASTGLRALITRAREVRRVACSTDSPTAMGWVYAEADTLLEATTTMSTREDDGYRALRATLRCMQLLASQSSGGGFGYNVVLTHIVPLMVPRDILSCRCQDAIGTFPTLRNDKYDSRRRAFTLAWNRGLHHLAYSIPNIP